MDRASEDGRTDDHTLSLRSGIERSTTVLARYGPYELVQGNEGPELRTGRKRGPAAFLLGGAFIAAAFVLRREQLAPQDAQAALAFFGAFLALIAWRRSRRAISLTITDSEVIYRRRRGERGERWPRARVVGVALYAPRAPAPIHRSVYRSPPRLWRVELRDADGQAFRGALLAAGKESAQSLAHGLAELLGVDTVAGSADGAGQ